MKIGTSKTLVFFQTHPMDAFPIPVTSLSEEENEVRRKRYAENKAYERELSEQIRSPSISVAKYAEVLKIPNDKLSDTIRDDMFEYFRIDTGMNILVPVGRINELRFVFSIFADGRQSNSAFAIDGFPNNMLKHVNIFDGKIKLNINNFLKIIPISLSQTIADVLDIDMNPWEIKWGYDKLEIGFSGAYTDKIEWYLSSENINQSFNCHLILKKRTTVKQVIGKVAAAWKYEPQGEGIRNWFEKRFRRSYAPVRSDVKEIEIIT